MDLTPKWVWYFAMANLKPPLATTCVARSLEFWLSQLLVLLESGSSQGGVGGFSSNSVLSRSIYCGFFGRIIQNVS